MDGIWLGIAAFHERGSRQRSLADMPFLSIEQPGFSNVFGYSVKADPADRTELAGWIFQVKVGADWRFSWVRHTTESSAATRHQGIPYSGN